MDKIHLAFFAGKSLCGLTLPDGYDEHRSDVGTNGLERCEGCAAGAQRVSKD